MSTGVYAEVLPQPLLLVDEAAAVVACQASQPATPLVLHLAHSVAVYRSSTSWWRCVPLWLGEVMEISL